VACTLAPGSLRLYFDSSRKKWTFGSGSLLCQRFGRRCEETVWKRRRIETSVVIVIFTLRVLTYVVSYKLSWNYQWIGAVRFVSQDVWLTKGLLFDTFYITVSNKVGTNCGKVITEHCSLNRYHRQWLGRQNNKQLEIKCITEWLSLEEDFLWSKRAAGQILWYNRIRRSDEIWRHFCLWILAPGIEPGAPDD